MNIAGKTEQHNLGKVQSGNTYVLIASFDRIVKSYDTCMNNQRLMVFGAARVNRQELSRLDVMVLFISIDVGGSIFCLASVDYGKRDLELFTLLC